MTDTLERPIEIIELEKLVNDELKCNGWDDCANPAAWTTTMPCCGKQWFLCDPHKQANDKYQRLLAPPTACRACYAPAGFPVWRPV